MAVMYCRPNSDSSLKHSTYGGSSQGYNKINDVTADGDSTYIYVQTSGGKSASASSNFGMTCTFPSTKCKVTGAKFVVNAKKSGTFSTSTVNVSASVNGQWNNAGTGTQTLANFYTDYKVNSGNLVAMLNESLAAGTMPTLVVNVLSKCDMSSQSTSKSAEQARVTQVYIEITYETPGTMYTKNVLGYSTERSILGVWEKKNGVYVEQDISTAFPEGQKYIFIE